jgi:hypothetical protein
MSEKKKTPPHPRKQEKRRKTFPPSHNFLFIRAYLNDTNDVVPNTQASHFHPSNSRDFFWFT